VVDAVPLIPAQIGFVPRRRVRDVPMALSGRIGQILAHFRAGARSPDGTSRHIFHRCDGTLRHMLLHKPRAQRSGAPDPSDT
jgi:hypothetical protein